MTSRVRYRTACTQDAKLVSSPLLEAGIFSRPEDVTRQIQERPWTIQVSVRGPAREHAVLDVWRRGTGMAIIRHLSAEPRKRRRFLAHLLDVLGEQGFRVALSPLLDHGSTRAFRRAGFVERERLIVFKKHGARFRDVKRVCEVRCVGPEDVESIATIDESCFDSLWRFSPDDLKAMLPGVTGFVAVKNGRLIGYNMVSLSREAGTVGRLAVLPDLQNQGVGSTLLAAGLDWLAEAGGTEITLCTQQENEASRRLYRRFGFEQLPDDVSLMQKYL